MKKSIFFLMGMLLSISLFAQKPHRGYTIQESGVSGETYWQIKGTESDTSGWNQSWEAMSIYWFAGDTVTHPADTDSTQITLYFQTTNTGKDIAITDRTLSIATDSSSGVWKTTMTAIGSGMYYRIIATGGSDNNNRYGSLLRLLFDGTQ